MAFQFMGEHPVLTFLLACIAASTLLSIGKLIRGWRDEDL